MRQRVPLERLVEGMRLDLRIIWQILLELAEPDRVPGLVQHVERLITVLDDYIGDVQQAFLAEVAILQRDSRFATEQHLSKLFNVTSLSPTLLHEIAQGIGIAPSSELEVRLFTPRSPEEELHRGAQHWLATHRVFGYVYRGWLLLFRELGDHLSTWPKEFANAPSIHVHRVSGLQAVAAAARAAVELQAATLEIHRLTDFEVLWVPGAADYLHSHVPGYFRAILGDIDQLPEEDRNRLAQTVWAFLKSGSIKVSSPVMNCHRNTVVNRLRLFKNSPASMKRSLRRQRSRSYCLPGPHHENSSCAYA